MHLVPCFRWPATALVGAALVIATVTSACSAGGSPSTSLPASPSSVSATPSPVASMAPSEPPATPVVTESPAATEPPMTEPPATAPAATEPPAAPDGLDYNVDPGVTGEGGLVMTRYTVSWTMPLDPGTSIRVFGITTCPNKPTADNPPCVTDRTPLPAKIRTLIAKGPAEPGSVSWEWPEADVDGPVLASVDGTSYFAFVVRAVNAAGSSPFVVVRSAVACTDCMS